MKPNLKSIHKKRKYSIEFKKQIVSEFESGRFSVIELEKLHKISNPTIYDWIYKFSKFNDKGYRIIEMKDSSSKKLKDLERKVKDLEAALGRKQIMIDYLETMMEVAKNELDIDLKKNFSTSPSVKSEKDQTK